MSLKISQNFLDFKKFEGKYKEKKIKISLNLINYFYMLL